MCAKCSVRPVAPSQSQMTGSPFSSDVVPNASTGSRWGRCGAVTPREAASGTPRPGEGALRAGWLCFVFELESWESVSWELGRVLMSYRECERGFWR